MLYKINTNTLWPGFVASYDLLHGNGEHIVLLAPWPPFGNHISNVHSMLVLGRRQKGRRYCDNVLVKLKNWFKHHI